MTNGSQSHADRLTSGLKTMIKDWQIFILTPLILGIFSAFILIPLTLTVLFGLVSLAATVDVSLTNAILVRILVIALLTIPTAVCSLINSQIILFALKDIDQNISLKLGNLIKASFKNLWRFFLVGVYTYIYTYAPLLLSSLAVLLVLLISAFLRSNNVLAAISTFVSLLLIPITIISIIIVFRRMISSLFTQIVCVAENLKPTDTLKRSIALTRGDRANWKTTLGHICILIGLGFAANIIAGGDDSIISSIIWMLLSSFTVITTYLLYKSFTQSVVVSTSQPSTIQT